MRRWLLLTEDSGCPVYYEYVLRVCVIYIYVVVYKDFLYHKVIGRRDVIDVMVVSSIFTADLQGYF